MGVQLPMQCPPPLEGGYFSCLSRVSTLILMKGKGVFGEIMIMFRGGSIANQGIQGDTLLHYPIEVIYQGTVCVREDKTQSLLD